MAVPKIVENRRAVVWFAPHDGVAGAPRQHEPSALLANAMQSREADAYCRQRRYAIQFVVDAVAVILDPENLTAYANLRFDLGDETTLVAFR
jgi:hypothetical protein